MSELTPTVMITGFPKCGTSSVFDWLNAHPDISGSQPKETYYFSDPGTHMFNPDRHIGHGLGRYRDFFPDCASGARVIIEATPSYAYSSTALERLPDLNPQMRFLFFVREPAQQIYSLFKYFQNNWAWIPADMGFGDFLNHCRRRSHEFGGNELAQDAIANARYVEHLERWRARVGKDRMTVHVLEDVIEAPRDHIQSICRDLGADPSFYDDFEFTASNETYRVRNSWVQGLNIAVRDRLPKGKIYERIRSAYRTLNTARPAGQTPEEGDLLAALSAEFHTVNEDLAARFDLDLVAWSSEGGINLNLKVNGGK